MTPPPESVPTVIVVPCFNEASRLSGADVAALAGQPGVGVLLVDDGSTDATLDVLHAVAAEHAHIDVLALSPNAGKAEAVRVGMRHALASGAAIVGFADADMATPVEELLRLQRVLAADPDVAAVIASRVALLGHDVQRSPLRHYLGRLFATAASVVLRLRVYDTQCGAKFFRASPALADALSEPFHSRWSFDVELLGRMLTTRAGVDALRADSIREVPLERWRDVGGSKLTVTASARSGLELVTIARALRRWSR